MRGISTLPYHDSAGRLTSLAQWELLLGKGFAACRGGSSGQALQRRLRLFGQPGARHSGGIRVQQAFRLGRAEMLQHFEDARVTGALGLARFLQALDQA